MLKHTYLFISIFFLYNESFAQTKVQLDAVVENYYGRNIDIELPYRGTAFGGKTNRFVITEVDGEDRVQTNLILRKDEVVGFYHFNTATYVRLWLSASGMNGMKFDWKDPLGNSRFHGESKYENEMLTSFDDTRNRLLNSDKQFTLTEILSFEQKEYELLQVSQAFSQEFKDFMTKDAEYFWLYFKQKQGLNIESKVTPAMLEDVEALKSRNYFYFLYEYFSRESVDLKTKYRNVQQRLKNRQVREAYWAFDLHEESTKEKVDFDIIEQYYLFEKSVSTPGFIQLAKTHILRIEDEYKVKSEPITADMIIYEGDLPFPELLKQFRGNVLYIDMWAVWCKPCIEEMRPIYKEPLSKFTKDKDVKVIYLSMDEDKNHDKWKKVVKDLRLNSFNTRLSIRRFREIADLLEMKADALIAIPRYFIFDKAGKLVNNKAPRPSEGEKLYAELAKYL